jgi:hypothetical protein
MVIIPEPLFLSYYHVTKFQAYTLLILDLFFQFYSYNISLSDKAKLIRVKLQLRAEIHVRVIGLFQKTDFMCSIKEGSMDILLLL